jgi:hypothetical protein
MRTLVALLLLAAPLCYGQVTVVGPATLNGSVTLNPGSGSGAAIVQSVKCAGNGNANCVITATLAGDLLVVDVFGDTGPTNQLTLTTDSGSNTYSNVYNTACTNSSNRYCRMDYFANIGAGVTSVTGNCGACGNPMAVNVIELSGMNTTSVLDTHAAQTGFGATTSWVSGMATTAHANDVLICSADVDGSSTITFTGTSGWTKQLDNASSASTSSISMITNIVSSIGTYDCTATASSSAEGSMAFSAFKVSP